MLTVSIETVINSFFHCKKSRSNFFGYVVSCLHVSAQQTKQKLYTCVLFSKLFFALSTTGVCDSCMSINIQLYMYMCVKFTHTVHCTLYPKELLQAVTSLFTVHVHVDWNQYAFSKS